MTKNEKINYWTDLSNNDFAVAETLIKNGHNLYTMDKREDIISIAKKYLELVKTSHFPMKINKAYLFGSHANGNPKKDSDIDIALIVNEWVGNYEETIVPIWRLRKSVDFRIEPHILVSNEDYADFLPEIQKTGIEL
ncbi:MAG: nucleotidyltransferase domain-containing protein [Treponema sp.]|jgi:predicted nucleotidyltransferase|nr:nucleotidyltransferase domain-containing protein [Treponema sp.]